MEKISVCIATYNGGKFIEEQLRSILAQLPADGEVIISDDLSKDNTLNIIQSLNDDRIVFITNKGKKGVIFNFENALKHANGDIIFLSDQDDVWLPNKVETMVRELQGYDMVLSNCFIGDTDLKIVRDSYFEWRNSGTGFWKNIWRNSYLGCCMCFNKRILTRAIPFPANIPMHDMWLGLISEVYFKPKFIDDKLIIYRRHNANTTVLTDNFESKETMYTRLKFRLNLLFAVILRILKLT